MYTYSLRCIPDDLDRVISGSMLGSHVVVHGGDSLAQGHVTVLPVHVVGSRSGIISQSDSVIVDLARVLFIHFLTGYNLSGSLLKLTQLTQEIPKPRLSNNLVRSKDLHPVQGSDRLLVGGQLPTNHLPFLQNTFSLHTF